MSSKSTPSPGLHIVGSEDHPETRHASYRLISGAPQYWLVAEGGHGVGSKGPHALLQDIVGQFISAYVTNDLASRNALTYSNFKHYGSAVQQFRTKNGSTWRTALDRRNLVVWLRETLPWGTWLHHRSIAYHRAQKAQVQ